MSRSRSNSRSTDSGAARKGRPGSSNQIRIVGGIHRGRRLSFPDAPGLRPTSDRTRETLFNWLQPWLPGARCLDLFAGSGALGFEAASRGAAQVTLLEQNFKAIQQLESNRTLLRLEQVRIQQADALCWLDQQAEPFDIIFLDPPFADHLLTDCCRKLDQQGWLGRDAHIYLEWDQHGPAPQLPLQWRAIKEKRAGQVAYALYTREQEI